MANLHPICLGAAFLTLLLLCSTTSPNSLCLADRDPYPYIISENGTTSHLRVYWYDKLVGPNVTSVVVAQAPSANSSATLFGIITVFDDALSIGPNVTSGVVGRAQGTYISTGVEKLALLMASNFVFTAGKYNGSSIAIFGPNDAVSKVREMAVVGGTGIFRMARGFAQARTYSFDATKAQSDSVVIFDVHVTV